MYKYGEMDRNMYKKRGYLWRVRLWAISIFFFIYRYIYSLLNLNIHKSIYFLKSTIKLFYCKKKATAKQANYTIMKDSALKIPMLRAQPRNIDE